jgi:hypothetical protein
MSLASLPDGGTLIGYGDSVHLLAGPPGTSMLTAAIRPGAGVAARRAYRARIVLSEPASITIRVYRAFNRPPVATMRAVRPAGESSVTIRLNKRVTAGLYALDLRAQRGSQATRAEQYVYLGGAVTVRSIRAIGTRVLADEFSNARNAYFSVGRCHQFNSRRVDCLTVAGGEDYIQASWLTRQGQLVVRTYNPPTRRHRPLFKLNPPWNAPPDQQDLGAAWNPSGYGALPPLDRFQ